MRLFGKIILAVLSVLGALALALAVVAWNVVTSFGPSHPDVPDSTVLVVDFTTAFRDGGHGSSGGPLQSQPTLRSVIEALDAAAADDSIKGVIGRFGSGDRPMAQAQELRSAVARLRAAGKPTFAYADSLGDMGGSPSNYYLASAFEKIWIQPSGMLGLNGFQAEIPFAHKALTDLGITAEFGQRWEYKNAMDSLIRNDMSAPQRASFERLFQSWQMQVIEAVAADRKLDKAKINAMMQHPPMFAAEARTAGLVDATGYWDELLTAVEEAAGTRSHTTLEDYAAAQPKPGKPNGTVIAVIEAEGNVHRGPSDIDGSGLYSSIGSDTTAEAIRDAINDPKVKAIVLRVNSPGGDYIAADSIWRELMRARDKRLPVIATLGDVAASGGYFIAMPARKIVAQPGTITGSIGVFAGKPVLTDLWAKLGIHWETVQTSPNATLWSPNRTFTPAERQWFDRMLDTIYADFTGKAAANRSLTAAQMDQVARGRIWTGSDAKAIGLVDELGDFSTAVTLARSEAGIAEDAPVSLVAYPTPPSGLEALLQTLLGGKLPGLLSSLSRLQAVLAPVLGVAEQISATADPRGNSVLAPGLPGISTAPRP
ncbi:signal peptide peptidase SppA [Novispirillum itersonii]|uniref:signal peptide peptidase SppA n=1 Tax=Novispirillum itersonii TaxID=189 RepID=UPI00036A1C30|nr:signal peptide peptidase SppA [Novispirillum itersonii]